MIKPLDIINIYEFSADEIKFSQYNPLKNSILKNQEKLKECPPKGLHYVLLPRIHFIEKQLIIPSVNDAEIVQMANIQALKLVPFSSEEIITHCQVFSRSPEGFSHVLLFIITQEKLFDLLNPLIDLGIFPEEIFISPLLVPRLNQTPAEKAQENNRFMSFYEGFLEIGFFEKGRLKYSRHLEFQNGNGNPETLSEEIRESFQYVSKKYDFRVSQTLYLFGNTDPTLMPGFPTISEHYEYIRYEKKDLFRAMADTDGQTSFSLSAVKSKQKEKESRIYLFRVLFVMAFAMFMTFVYFTAGNWLLQSRLAALNNEIKKIKTNAEWAKDAGDKMDTLTRHFSNSDNDIGAILELYKLLPQDMTLTLISFKDYKKVVIKGIAKKGVIELVDTLEKSPYFQNVALKYQNKTGKDEGVEFSLSCELENS